MHRCIIPIALMATSFPSCSVLADEARLCSSLDNAWLAAKRDISATAGHGIFGSSMCETTEHRFTCIWKFSDPLEARGEFLRMSGIAASCLSKVGLSPR